MIYEAEEGLIKETLPKKAKFLISAAVLVCLLVVTFVLYHFFIGPLRFKEAPNRALGGLIFEIKEGEGEAAVSKRMEEAGIISSNELFNIVAAVLGDTKKIIPGTYLFKKPLGIIGAERRIAKGDFGIENVKITIPEGFTARQVAERLEANLPLFDKDKFWATASGSEGYLFPETYFFTPGTSEQEIYTAMILMFRKETESIWPANISTSTKDEIVRMASVIEKEVRSPEDMAMVSGIFWKRIKIGMALQADSTLAYERGKTSAELTTEDLKKDSPYNTYTRRGLPPTAICNPGLNAIKAAQNPKDSPYLYFLTDKEGKVYYAKTFEEHKANKAKYL